MTVKDHFSRLADAYLLKNKASVNTKVALEEFINKNGSPSIIQSDNGTEFRGEFTKSLEIKGIKHIFGHIILKAKDQLKASIKILKIKFSNFMYVTNKILILKLKLIIICDKYLF